MPCQGGFGPGPASSPDSQLLPELSLSQHPCQVFELLPVPFLIARGLVSFAALHTRPKDNLALQVKGGVDDKNKIHHTGGRKPHRQAGQGNSQALGA